MVPAVAKSPKASPVIDTCRSSFRQSIDTEHDDLSHARRVEPTSCSLTLSDQPELSERGEGGGVTMEGVSLSRENVRVFCSAILSVNHLVCKGREASSSLLDGC